MNMDETADLIIWGHDYTPTICCGVCEKPLIDDPNGNAPLVFTVRQLTDAVAAHVCGGNIDVAT